MGARRLAHSTAFEEAPIVRTTRGPFNPGPLLCPVALSLLIAAAVPAQGGGHAKTPQTRLVTPLH